MRNQPQDLPIRQMAPATELDLAMAVDNDCDTSVVKTQDIPYESYQDLSHGKRIATEAGLAEAIRKQYPSLKLTVTPTRQCNLLAFAEAGHASATPIDVNNDHAENLKYRIYLPPFQRTQQGSLADSIQFGKYLYKWEQHGKVHDFIVYIVVGGQYPLTINMTYINGADERANDMLLMAASTFAENIHHRVLLFDGGYWSLSAELYQSIQNASWDDVILAPGMKRSIKGEVDKFFDSRDKYKKLKVPWKRGIIYYGPPGNGKTISIKATMHMLYARASAIPTLYVRSLVCWGGPENALKIIFAKARQQAPCLLVFEDLDSIVSDDVRSYFLNEVDGLKSNDGILMIGSTNHLERLDPGISKRPSRFDRKYLFPDPNLEERVAYCAYWRQKLEENEDIDFPEKMEWAIAGITKGFSFAYIQEAFVAALLTIANGEAEEEETSSSSSSKQAQKVNMCHCRMMHCSACMAAQQWKSWAQSGCRVLEEGDDDDLEQYVLWREIKKVVRSLRDELDHSE